MALFLESLCCFVALCSREYYDITFAKSTLFGSNFSTTHTLVDTLVIAVNTTEASIEEHRSLLKSQVTNTTIEVVKRNTILRFSTTHVCRQHVSLIAIFCVGHTMSCVIHNKFLVLAVANILKPLELLFVNHSLCTILYKVNVLRGDAERFFAILLKHASIVNRIRNARHKAVVLVTNNKCISVVVNGVRCRNKRVDFRGHVVVVNKHVGRSITTDVFVNSTFCETISVAVTHVDVGRQTTNFAIVECVTNFTTNLYLVGKNILTDCSSRTHLDGFNFGAVYISLVLHRTLIRNLHRRQRDTVGKSHCFNFLHCGGQRDCAEARAVEESTPTNFFNAGTLEGNFCNITAVCKSARTDAIDATTNDYTLYRIFFLNPRRNLFQVKVRNTCIESCFIDFDVGKCQRFTIESPFNFIIQSTLTRTRCVLCHHIGSTNKGHHGHKNIFFHNLILLIF